jgi:glyoxylase-like metal-dependent hydrolase (beta-lactamase superfamily II)
MELIDLHHLGKTHAIGSWWLRDVLIDCGPASCLPRLLEQLRDRTPRALMLTHIHLDHAGAAGEMVRRWPDLTVYVHSVGARHMIDPSRLVRSAERIYGDQMDSLWGPITPVPEKNLRVLDGGEKVYGLDVAYTPGHASHHVAFFDEESGCAFVGDAGGVRIVPSRLIMPHAPPPDIDLEAWSTSLEVIAGWRPASLALPHYGLVEDVEAHLEETRRRLVEKANLARGSTQEEFVARAHQELEAEPSDRQDLYLIDSPPDHMYFGLRRYWDKRSEADAA